MRQITSLSTTCTKGTHVALRLLLAAVLALSGLIFAAPAWADDPSGQETPVTGTCGENLTWSLADGTLTISGTGEMDDYDSFSGYITSVPWFGYCATIEHIIISSGVTSIGRDAFSNCTSLTSITIPEGVVSIGRDAFSYCTSLTSVTIPASVTSIRYDTHSHFAFYGCTSLVSITVDGANAHYSSDARGAIFNKSGTELIRYPQGNLAASYDIPEGVTSIAWYAFYNCAPLASITIPASVASIGYDALSGCASLVSITVDGANAHYSSDARGALFNKGKTELIQYPTGNSAASYDIPEGVTSIGYNAFGQCAPLVSVTIPSSVVSIETAAFFGCASLASIIIPTSVTSIGSGAFSDCSSLSSVTIPASVTSIESSAFSYCTSLAAVIIPTSVVTIGRSAFRDCTSLTSVTIPASVTSIEDHAFYYCTSLTSVIIPEGVTSIGDSVFYGCTSLAVATILENVTLIGDSVFNGCTSLVAITVDGANAHYSSDARGTLFDKGKTELIQYPAGNSAVSYDIPEGVASIEHSAFFGCASLASVIIPSSVTTIGGGAFYGCSSLVSVAIPEGVDLIGGGAFEGCTSLAAVTIPASVTLIGHGAFYFCASLTSITVDGANAHYSSDARGALFNKGKTELIRYPEGNLAASYDVPEGVTSIGGGAFDDCTSLASITIPASVTSIGYGTYSRSAFFGCASLASITVDSANTQYSSDIRGALFDKKGTELIRYPQGNLNASYNIPAGVTSVGYDAFDGCAFLTSVTIPESVTSIEWGAFYGCPGPIYCEASSKPSGWAEGWTDGYTGQVFWGQSAPAGPDDTEAPVLSAGSAVRNSATTAAVSFTSNEAGSYYYAVVASGAPAPALNTTGAGAVLVAGTQTFEITNLASTGAFDVYLVGKDAAGNVSAALKVTIPALARTVTQHEGTDRQDTAVRASQKAYPDPSVVDSVILAYSYNFPDALAASYLAGALNAPILLTDTPALDEATALELARLRPSTVYIVGGTGSVSANVEGTLDAYDFTSDVIRLGGAGREETAYLIANEAKAKGGAPTTAFIADAANFPDALSAGSLSASQGVPILLTATGELDGWASRFLTENVISDVIIVGGPGSVSEGVAGQLRALSHGPTVVRWSGTDRYATSKAVLDNAIAKWDITPTVVGLASGDGFPDALVGGAAVGNRGGLLAITDPDDLSDGAIAAISAHKDTLTDVEIFGGTGTIRVADEVQALLA